MKVSKKHWRSAILGLSILAISLDPLDSLDLPGAGAGVPSTPGALGVARRAAVALWSFDWTHPPAVPPKPLRRWVTARLWAKFAASPGAPAARSRDVREHERVRVVSVSVVVADRMPSAVGVAVSAAVVVTAAGRARTRGRFDGQMLVTSTRSGWRVAEIQV